MFRKFVFFIFSVCFAFISSVLLGAEEAVTQGHSEDSLITLRAVTKEQSQETIKDLVLETNPTTSFSSSALASGFDKLFQ